MDLLDRLLAHNHWTTREFLTMAESLTDEQLDQQFDIGHQSLRATFEHIVHNVEVWSAIMTGLPHSRAGESDVAVAGLITRLDKAAERLAKLAKSVRDRNAWDELWLDPIDGQEKTYGGAIAHVITHSMHHRAQIRYLMRCLGVSNLPEGDVLTWEMSYSDE